jgi:prevent-host-death family protein
MPGPAKRASGARKAVVNLYEAKTQLSALVERASRGEEITIAKAGKPMARLVPIGSEPRQPGALKGRIRVSADFDALLPADLLAGFSGGQARDEDA